MQRVLTGRVKIGPCGIATGMDIGLSNASLKFITLAFYSMVLCCVEGLIVAVCKSSTLAFVLGFAFLFHLERPEWKLIAVITILTIGVILMVTTEAQFVLTGYPSSPITPCKLTFTVALCWSSQPRLYPVSVGLSPNCCYTIQTQPATPLAPSCTSPP